jgi:hypothetical protein
VSEKSMSEDALRQGVKEAKADKFKSFEQVFGEPQ